MGARAARKKLRQRQLEWRSQVEMLLHDVRQPLAAASGRLDSVRRQIGRGQITLANVDDEIEKTRGQLQQLERRIESFLDDARVESEGLSLHRSRTRIDRLIGALVESLPASQRRRIQLRVEGDERSGLWDRDRLRAVMQNLLDNALRYSDPGEAVLVDVAFGRGDVRIAVRDRGIGISAQEKEKVFSRFYRSERASDVAPGSGIGLYGAREVVLAHGGRLTASSEGPGHGSTFELRLPLHPRV